MKKIKRLATVLIIIGFSLLASTQKALADLLPPDGGWKGSSNPNFRPEPKSFMDLIEPQHIIIGTVVLLVIIISFAVLFKMRKK